VERFTVEMLSAKKPDWGDLYLSGAAWPRLSGKRDLHPEMTIGTDSGDGRGD